MEGSEYAFLEKRGLVDLARTTGQTLEDMICERFCEGGDDYEREKRADGQWFKCDDCGTIDKDDVHHYECAEETVDGDKIEKVIWCKEHHNRGYVNVFYCKICVEKFTCSQCKVVGCDSVFHRYDCGHSSGCKLHLGDPTKCIKCKGNK